MDVASYVNQARRAAGLSQRELAARAGVPQPAIARIEKGHQVPRADTLARLLDACGFELRLGPKRGGGVDRGLIQRWLRLSPAERAAGTADYGRTLARLRQAKKVS
ncbi:MAG: helix-turn-helix domain-containing protein [Acidimicrobiales bacterium]